MEINNVNQNLLILNNTDAKGAKQKLGKNDFINAFKNYFNGIKNNNSYSHDITASDIKNVAEQVHNDLIKSGVKVVSYDERTGMTKYSNGVELYYETNDNGASLTVELNEKDNYVGAVIETVETENNDYNNLLVVEDDNSNNPSAIESSSYVSNITKNEKFGEISQMKHGFLEGAIKSQDQS